MVDRDAEAMYEPFAHHFAAHTEDNSYNARYDRPAMLRLIGSVDGCDVLDAGCGAGFYTEAMLAGGARVTAVDASPTMVELTRARVGERASIRVADLDRPIEWLANSSLDLIVLPLVLHHLHRRDVALAEFRRILRPGGHVVLSTVHPTADWLRLGGSYFDVAQVHETWNEGWDVSFWRQPLESWCAEFTDAGFLIERVVEPRPDTSMRESDPETYERLLRSPEFIAFRLLAV